MRHVWISLLLCASACGAAACPAAAPPERPLAHDTPSPPSPPAPARTPVVGSSVGSGPAEAHKVKVSVVATPAMPAAQGLAPSPSLAWHDDPLAAPLLASALAMVMIALRRGGR